MMAAQQTAWAIIQARIAAEAAPAPGVEKALSNGHSHNGNHQASADLNTLVPLVAANDDPDASEADNLYHPSAVPQPSAPVTMVHSIFGKSGVLNPRRALFVALAASLIVGSFATLFLAHFSLQDGSSTEASTPLFNMGVFDPGTITPAFSFDPVSRHLLTLSGAQSYSCPPGAHCPSSGPTCLGFSMLDVESGKSLGTIRPTCSTGGDTHTGAAFTKLLDDSPLGTALLIGSDEQVTAVDNRNGVVTRTYALACCNANAAMQPDYTLLDQHDQLLLTTATSGEAGVPDTLVAQNATTGQFKYRASLDTSELQHTLVSDVTGWLYLWNRCAADSNASCVEVYEANSGKKVSDWKPTPQQTPLAADPTENVVYVRQDQPNGQSETLVLDGRSGMPVGQLPIPAEAMAINAPLHHAYLLGDDGVTVVDTRTRRKLSTLPVLAHDESWIAPAVDAATSRVYLPIQRGKLLMAQDDADGQLNLRSASLEVVLDAERTMVVNAAKGDMALYPWELPLGAETFPVYHPLSEGTQQDCGIGWVAARSAAKISEQGNGQYKVLISLSWDDHFAGLALTSSPTPQSSYPHQHTWLYAVPQSGAAWLSSEEGEGFSSCQAAGR